MRLAKETEDVYELLELTKHEDFEVRYTATSMLCPCKVQDDIEEFWERVFELVDDEDPRIRSRILHILCDGSPERFEQRIYEALEKFNRDPDSDIRRTAHKVRAKASRGTWNVL